MKEQYLEEVSEFIIESAEYLSLGQIQQEIERNRQPSNNGSSFLFELMNRFPRILFLLGKYTGLLTKSLINSTGVIVLSNINMPGVDEMITAGVGYGIIINPGRLKDGKLTVNLAFNHQLANARPLAAYLAEVKDILEHPHHLLTNTGITTTEIDYHPYQGHPSKI